MISHNWSPMKRLIWLRGSGAVGGAGSWETISGNPVSFTAKAAPLRQLKVAFSPVQAGSGDPSPDNVRPISGWDSLNVYDDPLYAGVVEWNQLIKTSATASFNSNGITFTNNNDGSWTINGTSETSARINAVLGAITDDLNVGHKYLLCGSSDTVAKLSVYGMGSASAGGSIFTYTGDANKTYRFDSGVAVSATYDNFKIYPQIFDLTQMFGAGNEPATVEDFKALFPHDYYPYNAGEQTLVGTVNGMDTRSISISLGSTVYSGYVDVVTGVVTVDKQKITITSADGVYGFSTNSSGYYRARYYNYGSWFKNHSAGIYSVGKVTTASNAYNWASPNYFFTENTSVFVMPPSGITTEQDYKAWLDSIGGVEAVVELKTPLTIQLTPQEVESLAGDNTMWTDANGDLTVEYRSN